MLRQNGHAGFTTRRVARAAGIAPGNLAYHFPSKLALLRALIAGLVGRYAERLEAALQAPGLAAGRDVAALVRWLMADAIAPETVWLFRELWAMALRDEVVREAVDDFYDAVMGRIATALQGACPAANPQSIADLVQFIALLSEGSTVLYGTRRTRVAQPERMVDLTVRLVGLVVPELAAPTPGRRELMFR